MKFKTLCLFLYCGLWTAPAISKAQILRVLPEETSPISELLNENSSSEQTCDHFAAILVLRCVSPLIEYTKQYSRTGPTANPRIICSLYDDYKKCAPASIRRTCSKFVASVESVYQYVCSSEVRFNFTRSYGCLAAQERHPIVITCENSVTTSLRQIVASAGNSSIDERTDMQCHAIREYFRCVKGHFKKECGSDGWKLKQEITMRSTAVGLVKCPNLDDDPLEPICENDGSCHCRDGLVLDESGRRCQDLNECENGFGLCSQRCENTIGSYKCYCDERFYRLEEDKKTCIRKDDLHPAEASFGPVSIIFAHGQNIWNISMDGEDFQLLRAGLQKAAMIDIYTEERRLYYVDIGAGEIESIKFEGAFPSSVQNIDVDGTEGIAIDWVTKNLYSLRHTDVYVQTLEGHFRKVLYQNVLKLPRALVVYPHLGYLYASDWGQHAFIARAATDGSKFDKMITTDLVWPNGLTIDYYADRLYWADAFLDVIECSNLDGSERRIVLRDPTGAPHVFSMVIFDDDIYWTDWTFRGIARANKFTGDNVTVVAKASLLPYGIKLHHPATQPPGKNPCEDSKCSQLCVSSPVSGNLNESVAVNQLHINTLTGGGRIITTPPPQKPMSTYDYSKRLESVCMCADGFELAPDERSCIAKCDPDTQMQCGGKYTKCLSLRYKCDGIAHCEEDRSDEQNCPVNICLKGQYQCKSGNQCILKSQVCNGTPECLDTSDEKYC